MRRCREAASASSVSTDRSRHLTRALACAVLLSVSALFWPVAWAGGDAAPALPSGVPTADRARIENVLSHATISTRVQIEPYPLRLDVFDYLLNHPDFATQVTRALKLARYRIWTSADGLNLDDGWGVKGVMTPFYGDKGLRVVYARGRYEQSVLPDIRGQAIIFVRYDERGATAGRPALVTSMEVFAWLDSGMIASLAGPLAKSKATSEAQHALKVFSRLSTHLELRADEVLAELARRPEVSRPELEEFRRLLGR
jgi:hypothetical protein